MRSYKTRATTGSLVVEQTHPSISDDKRRLRRRQSILHPYVWEYGKLSGKSGSRLRKARNSEFLRVE